MLPNPAESWDHPPHRRRHGDQGGAGVERVKGGPAERFGGAEGSLSARRRKRRSGFDEVRAVPMGYVQTGPLCAAVAVPGVPQLLFAVPPVFLDRAANRLEIWLSVLHRLHALHDLLLHVRCALPVPSRLEEARAEEVHADVHVQAVAVLQCAVRFEDPLCECACREAYCEYGECVGWR